MADALIYVVRPDRTSIWIPLELATLLGVERGAELTPEQYAHPEMQRLLEQRRPPSQPR